MSFPYSSVRLASVSSFLPSFAHDIPPLHAYRNPGGKEKTKADRKRLDFGQGRGRTKGFRAEVSRSQNTLVSLGGGDKVTLKTLFLLFFLPTVASLLPFFFFCLYHLSKGHSSRSVESARPDSPPPTHPAAECLRSASLRSQNPARQSHPAFPANKKNTSLRGHLHLPGGR